MLRRALIVSAMIAVLGSPVSSRTSDIPRSPRLPGYFGSRAALDERIFLPPPPADGSPRGEADIDQFRVTRVEEGTTRWKIAARDSDAVTSPSAMLDTFACAMGLKLRPDQAPSLIRVLQRSLADSFSVIGPPKTRYSRPRPFRREDGPVCVPMSPEFKRSGSYPSGHSTVGWIYALILAELLPDRASEVLARGQAFGDSRVVCGVHYLSDVEAGYTSAAGLVAVLHSSPAFEVDMKAAGAELVRLRKSAAAPDASSCGAERAVLYSPGW